MVERAKKHPVIAFLGIVVTFYTAGFGSYKALLSLTNQETVPRDTLSRITQERDQLSAKVEECLKENAEMRRFSPMLEQFGPSVSEYHAHRVAMDAGGLFQVGTCPSNHCLTVRVDSLSLKERTPFAKFLLSGRWGPIDIAQGGLFDVDLTMLKGCRFTARLGSSDITFAVIDDRVPFMRIAAAVTPGTGRVALEGVTCPSTGG